MGTQHPTGVERLAIKRSAEAGDESAANYLKFLDCLTEILENSNGISLARGMVGEHNDVYGHAIDDALADLVPVIIAITPGGWESLQFYAPVESVPAQSEEAE